MSSGAAIPGSNEEKVMEVANTSRPRTMHDSGLGSFGSESDTSPVQQTAAAAAAAGPGCATGSASGPPPPYHHHSHSSTLFESTMENLVNSEKCKHRSQVQGRSGSYLVTYLGECVLDRRYTQPMLPWIMAEIRRTGSKRVVRLEVMSLTLRATDSESYEVLFEHKLQSLSRFARTHQDPRCFAYLTRANHDIPFSCQVFLASDESLVPHLFTAIREATKEAVREQGQLPVGGGTATAEGVAFPTEQQLQQLPASIPMSHLCEVMYVGKVVVSGKKAAPTFIDETVTKFTVYNERKQAEKDDEVERRRRSSGTSVQSLPSDLENIDVCENELEKQTGRRSRCISEGNAEDSVTERLLSADSNDNIPLGGSSGCIVPNPLMASIDTLHQSSQVQHLLDDASQNQHEDTNKLITHSEDSIKNALNEIKQSQQNGSISGSSDPARGDTGGGESFQRSVLQGDTRKNRTMLIQVCQSHVCLISPDRKRIIFERKFNDISFCSQGIQHPEHFGFIARDPTTNQFLCYVFRCATEALVEEVMKTLKQAFHTAFQQNSKGHAVCELCPMHQLHKLCTEIDKLAADKAHEILQKRIGQLSEDDQRDILKKYEAECPQSVQDRNEVLVSVLHHLCETKQADHIHISDSNRAQYKCEFNLTESRYKSSKFDSFTSKARKSLTDSFENIRRSVRRDEAREAFPERSWTDESNESDSNGGETPDHTPVASPSSKEFSFQLPGPLEQGRGDGSTTAGHQADTAGRPRRGRSATVPELPCLPQLNDSQEEIKQPVHSPLRTMFMNSKMSSGTPSPTGHRDNYHGTYTPHACSSWRRDILNRVVTPARVPRNKTDASASTESLRLKLSPQRLRDLWRKAILETLLLIRMERENRTLQDKYDPGKSPNVVPGSVARQDEIEQKRIRLDYEEITPCLKEVTKVWDSMLATLQIEPPIQLDPDVMTNALKDGVPRSRRGFIWQLLVEQHLLHHPELQQPAYSSASLPISLEEQLKDFRGHQHQGQQQQQQQRSCPASSMNAEADPSLLMPYQDLLKQLTTHQHQILIDLGRTFPGHPYFSTQLGAGQLALFNLLKAYSLLDHEVGYCQGLSFVAGILLMHMPEERAFHTMRYMMFQLGFRRQYRPDMVALQIQLYQLSRLLHDHHRDLYDHLESLEIVPTLYAAPWFLTVFASQFPLGFVARVYDLIFLQGLEVVFKVALVLLGNHKELIKQCCSFETIMEFLKTTLPEMGIIQMERIINQVFQLDLSQQLHAYEVEYHVLQEEVTSTALHCGDEDDVVRTLEMANQSLKQQNMELLEQLQAARSHAHSLDSQLHNSNTDQNMLRSHIKTLELERAALLNAVSRLRGLVPADVLDASNIAIPSIHADKNITHSPIHNPLVSRFLEDLDLKFTSTSLTEVDKEVTALMASEGRGQRSRSMLHRENHHGDNLLVVEDAMRDRPASSNY